MSITVTFGEQVVSPPPTRISNSERPPGEGLKAILSRPFFIPACSVYDVDVKTNMYNRAR